MRETTNRLCIGEPYSGKGAMTWAPWYPADVKRDPSILRTVPAFGGLTLETLDFILKLAQTRRVESGEYFCHEHEHGDSVFILEEGEVEIFKSQGDREIHLRTLDVGACFGEMALIAVIPRSASVRATQHSAALQIKNSSLFKLYEHDLAQFTMLVMNLAREVCRRLYDTDQRLFELATRLDD